MAVPPVIEWRGGAVRILDQRRLPDAIEVLHCTEVAQVMEAIRTLAIRGAPALGVAGAYGVALGAHSYNAEIDGPFADHLDRVVEDIAGTRPTAVNLGWAARIVRTAAEPHGEDAEAGAAAVLERAHALVADNDRRHDQLAAHGAGLLAPGAQVLHHCNTGPLATGAGFGSALGVIQAAHRQGKVSVWVNETRPLLQGARLTTWELDQWGIPYTLITDSMAGHFMQRGVVDAVVVGADRIAANGDVANKIGTYTMAQLARAHGLPFIVAAPMSTIDFETATGRRHSHRGTRRGRGARARGGALGAGRRAGGQSGVRRDAECAGERHRDGARGGSGALHDHAGRLAWEPVEAVVA